MTLKPHWVMGKVKFYFWSVGKGYPLRTSNLEVFESIIFRENYPKAWHRMVKVRCLAMGLMGDM